MKAHIFSLFTSNVQHTYIYAIVIINCKVNIYITSILYITYRENILKNPESFMFCSHFYYFFPPINTENLKLFKFKLVQLLIQIDLQLNKVPLIND